jgi:DNA-binding MarR family transcriptional regulator
MSIVVNDFDMPRLCNCTKLRRAARHVSRFYDAQLAASGLRITQYAILGHLAHLRPTMLELAELMTMDRATIGHNLRPLERDGLVKIEVDAKDRRVRRVSITEAGLERLALGWSGWRRAQAEFEAEFGAEQAAALRQVMDRVATCSLGEQKT